jgi:hypothetical protein
MYPEAFSNRYGTDSDFHSPGPNWELTEKYMYGSCDAYMYTRVPSSWSYPKSINADLSGEDE